MSYCLLNDRRLAVAYEPYASAKYAAPILPLPTGPTWYSMSKWLAYGVEDSGVHGIDLPRKDERILRILLDKLGQMQPGMANLLVIHTREELARSIDLDRLMQAVKTKADRKEPALYAASRYTGPAAFYKDFGQLSGILLWAAGRGCG